MGKQNNVLTEKEFIFLKLLAKGYFQKEIAVKLSLSVNSVGNQLSRLAHKLGVSGQVNIIRMALIHGILTIDDLKEVSNECVH